jgi:predicted enzyme related to lactoylglutathione lyase
MPERDSYKPGTPSWVELGTSDVDAAAAFYGGLFGWDVAESQPDTGGYRIAEIGGKAVAGLSPLMQEGQPVAWSTYVATDDADATAERVRSSGGQVIVEPMDVMELGRFAVFMDPTGAAIGVWQANQFAGAQLVNEPGALTWNELATRDMAAAQDFYKAVFGWDVEERDFGGSKYTMWQADGDGVGGGMPMGDQFPPDVPPHWAVYFFVEDAEASAARARELGGQVRVEAMDIPDMGRFAALADPQGAGFSVFQSTQAG